MNTAATSSPRWQRRIGGLALYGLIWSLPTATVALLLAKLFRFEGLAGSPVGAAVFVAAFVLFATLMHALLGRRFPHLLPVSKAASTCIEDSLSQGEKIERLQRDALVWRLTMWNSLVLSLLTIVVLALR